MKLFDTHCHLCDERFDEDRAQVIERMREAGVMRALLVGDAARDPVPCFRLAQENPMFWAAAGVHPQDASIFTSKTSGERYTTSLERCTCPAFYKGYACKHMLALAMHLGYYNRASAQR